jgi:hydrogenase nickel incorporation protein HypA/HybF
VHELSIAQSILDIVRQHVPTSDLSQVRTVRVIVGEGAGVVADSLSFSFEAIVAETPMASARMEIEHIPFRLQCASCRVVSSNDAGLRICPECGSASTTILSGTELQVKEIELDDKPGSAG